MNKPEICAHLTALNIPFEVTEHEAVYTMEELAKIPLAQDRGRFSVLLKRLWPRTGDGSLSC